MTQKPPEPVFVLRGSSVPIRSVEFLGREGIEGVSSLAAGTQDGRVMMWDLKTKSVSRLWQAHNSPVIWLKKIGDNSLWTCGRAECLSGWDMEHATEKYKFPLDDYLGYSQCDMVVGACAKTFAVIPGPSMESVTVYDVDANLQMAQVVHSNPSTGAVIQCKFVENFNGFDLLVLYENGKLSLWDCKTWKVKNEVDIGENPVCMEYDKSLQKGLIGTPTEKVFTFSVNVNDGNDRSGSLLLTKEFTLTNSGLSSCISRPDGKIFATAGWDSRVRIFTWKSYKPLAVLMHHKQTVECLAFSNGAVEHLSNSYLLAAGSSDRSISLWDVF